MIERTRPTQAISNLSLRALGAIAPIATEWSNLLLGCPRCNRDFKKNKNNGREGYLWPDTHDTYHAFVYESTGRVLVNDALDGDTKQAAENTKALVKLDDGGEKQITLNLNRRKVFRQAQEIKELFQAGAMDADGVMTMLDGTPYWSVWMTVFSDVPEVKELLLNSESFPNTAIDYFQVNV